MKILGACNPSLAHAALGIDPSLALLLPCNVVIEDVGEGGTRVAIADPRTLLVKGDIGDDRLTQLATEASTALAGALARLAR